MLPSMRGSAHGEVDSLLSGDFAMEALLNAMLQQGARKSRLQAKAFGGGTIIETQGELMRIGERNVRFTQEWLEREHIPLLASDFLGPWSRKILFVPNTGDAYCRRLVTNMTTASRIAAEERAYAESLNRAPTTVGRKVELF